jgi:tetratricopeptide (TPR) repeat protein
MAEVLQAMGKIDQALSIIDQEGTGSGLDWYTAEFLRIRGDVYAAAGDAVLAQEIYDTSLSIADAQGALSRRLRTARSLSRLLFQLGRRADALECLEGTLQRFSEGFQTRDFSKREGAD